MKQYPLRFKLYWNGIEWAQSEITLDSGIYFYYFYWWNWMPKGHRSWRYEQIYYDGSHSIYNLWFVTISWSTPWTRIKKNNY